MNILPQRSRLLRNHLVRLFTYLRIRFIFPLNSSSHACVLMARILEITWFNKEKRLSETTAVRRRSVAHREDNATKNGTRKKRHMTPMRACQPIKYTRNTTVPGMTRVRSKMLPKISINVCSSSRWTSFESRSITCPVVNFSRSALLSCRICQNSYCEIIVLNYYY